MYRLFVLISILFFASSIFSQDLYDVYSVKEIRVTIDEPDWAIQLDELKDEKKRLLATVKVDGITYDSVGIRFKGNSSFFNVQKSGSSKLPFNIKINYIKKDQRLKGNYTTLKLSNVFRDPSFLREVMSYEIARNYMPSPKANYAKLYINDEYMGLYNNTESVDKNFLEKHFAYKEGVLVKCDPSWDHKVKKGCFKGDKASLMFAGKDSMCYDGLYELKSDYGWSDLLQLVNTLNKKPANIEKILNIDQTLWMLAYNNILVNLDSYTGRLSHNYYMYRDTFGIFHPILWDMNLSFGGFRFDGNGAQLTNEQMQKLSPFLHYKTDNKKRPLINVLLKNDLYRKIYIAHLKTILEDHFTNYAYQKRASDIQKTIDYYVKSDENKLYSYEAYKQNLNQTSEAGKTKIIGITELMNARASYLKAHPLFQKKQPRISEAKHQLKDEQYAITVRLQDADNAWLFYRLKDKAPFQKVAMKDDGTKGDGSADDKVFGAMIEKVKGAQYYIVAENERTVIFSPPNASFEFYEIK